MSVVVTFVFGDPDILVDVGPLMKMIHEQGCFEIWVGHGSVPEMWDDR